MKSMEELIAHLKAEGHLIHDNPHVIFDGLKSKFHIFIGHLEQEGKEEKAAFQLVVDATFKGKVLTHEEKVEIEDQLKDSLKIIGLLAFTVLPGGSLFFILSTFLKLNKYLLPSAFLGG